MKLVIFNGSPRKNRGNTAMFIQQFLSGFMLNSANSYEVYNIHSSGNDKNIIDKFLNADYVFIAFPLYTDAMHGRVKRFIEQLSPLSQNAVEKNPKLLFLVQSGFIEASHSRGVERYLKKLAKRLNCEYVGTIIRSGVETTYQILPKFIGRPVVKLFRDWVKKLGKEFSENGMLNDRLLKKFSYPEKLPGIVILFYHLYSLFGIKYFGFDSALKKNKAYKLRDAKPYAAS
ncbi:MAG: NAD(P)H-dependent oxidoreductase [Ignavibacteria bacterium]|jgi:hypothetical protein